MEKAAGGIEFRPAMAGNGRVMTEEGASLWRAYGARQLLRQRYPTLTGWANVWHAYGVEEAGAARKGGATQNHAEVRRSQQGIGDVKSPLRANLLAYVYLAIIFRHSDFMQDVPITLPEELVAALDVSGMDLSRAALEALQGD